jgi:hypothetical protein
MGFNSMRALSLRGLVLALVLIVHSVAAQEWGKEDWVVVYTAADEPNATSGYAAEGKAIAMDDGENVYVLGEASVPDRRTDAVVYRYNRENGAVVWRDVYNHVPSSSPRENDGTVDLAGAIAADGAGNTCVAINSGNERYSKDYRVVVRMYGADHTTGADPAWTFVYGTADDGHQEACAVALDESGSCYVAGYNAGGGMLFKVNTSGTPGSVNVRQESEAEGGWVYFYDLALDAAGNIYVCGQAQLPGSPTPQDNLVAKYDASGALQWLKYLGDSTGVNNRSALALSPDESSVYVSGRHVDASDRTFWSVARFNATDGEEAWHDYYRGSDASGPHYPTSIAVDAAGDVLVAGIATHIGTGADMTVVKYEGTALLNRMWSAHYSGDTASEWEIAVGVGTDASNNVYVSGQAYFSEPIEKMRDFDYATVKYAPEGGAPLSVFHYDHNEYPAQSERPAAMIVAPSGTVAVTGAADNHGTILFPMITVLYAGNEEEPGDIPSAPVFIPVLHIKARLPSTAGGATVSYTYEWNSTSGQNVIHADKLEAEDALYEGENGIIFTPGETWTVTVTPKAGGVTGASFTGEFTMEDTASVQWGDKAGLEDAVHVLQILTGSR